MTVENERITTMVKIGIKLQEKRITKQKCDTTVKVETDTDKASTLCMFPGAEAKLTKLATYNEGTTEAQVTSNGQTHI
jgi:hypothetical protein